MRFRIVGGLSLPDWVVHAISELHKECLSKEDYFQLVSNSKEILLGKPCFEKSTSVAAVTFLLQNVVRFNAVEALDYELRLLVASKFLAQSMLEVVPELEKDTKNARTKTKTFSVKNLENGLKCLTFNIEGKIIEKELSAVQFRELLDSLKEAERELQTLD